MKGFLLMLLCTVSSLVLAADETVLRSFEEILSCISGQRPGRFTLDTSGQVISKHHSEFNQKLNKSFSLFGGNRRVDFYDITDTDNYNVGDIVRVKGYVCGAESANKDGDVFAIQVETLSHAPLPEVRAFHDIPSKDMSTGQHAVFASGVVADVVHDPLSDHFSWITLATPTDTLYVYASGDEYSFSDLRKLTDSEIRVCGLLGPVAKWKRFKNRIQLFGINGIEIVRKPPVNPFDAPHFPCDTLHRQQTAGTVKGKTDECLFVVDGNGRFLTIHADTPLTSVQIGDYVTAVGFPVYMTYGVHFLQALIRLENSHNEPLDVPETISGPNLADDPVGHEPVNYRYHGKAVSIKGVLRSDANETAATGVLRLDCESREVEVDVTGLAAGSVPSFQHESVLQVTGVCVIEFENDNSTLGPPRFRRYLLVPRSADDIRLVARPKGWLTSALLAVISVLVVMLVAVSFWTKSLKVLSERRGHALSLALTARVRAESRTQERTRLALELHDSISQTLTGVALQIDAATTASQKTPNGGSPFLATAKMLLSSCRKELQNCLWDLRCRTFEEKDLTEAVSRTLAPFQDKCTVLVRFNVPRETLSESAVHAVLNIVRELTANAIRHGHAASVRVAGEFKDGRIRFSVTDDGVGFDVGKALGPHDGHFGLQGVRERINDFNGELDLSSHPGKGTRAIVAIDPDTNRKNDNA